MILYTLYLVDGFNMVTVESHDKYKVSFLKELISEEGWNNYDPRRIKFCTDAAKTMEMFDDFTVGFYLNHEETFFVKGISVQW